MTCHSPLPGRRARVGDGRFLCPMCGRSAVRLTDDGVVRIDAKIRYIARTALGAHVFVARGRCKHDFELPLDFADDEVAAAAFRPTPT